MFDKYGLFYCRIVQKLVLCNSEEDFCCEEEKITGDNKRMIAL
jgi:hypothetical protein